MVARPDPRDQPVATQGVQRAELAAQHVLGHEADPRDERAEHDT